MYKRRSGTEEKNSRRASNKITGKSGPVLDMCEEIVESLHCDTDKKPLLLRTHYDLVRYVSGGHFAPHRDFQVLFSCYGEPCTLLVCVEAPDLEGGDTLVWLEPDGDPTRIKWCEGRAAVFPCGLLHAGEKVIRGVKTLLRADVVLWKKEARDLPVSVVGATTTDSHTLLVEADSDNKDYLGGALRFGGELSVPLANDVMHAASAFIAGIGVDNHMVDDVIRALDILLRPASGLSTKDQHKWMCETPGFCASTSEDTARTYWDLGTRPPGQGVVAITRIVVSSSHRHYVTCFDIFTQYGEHLLTSAYFPTATQVGEAHGLPVFGTEGTSCTFDFPESPRQAAYALSEWAVRDEVDTWNRAEKHDEVPVTVTSPEDSAMLWQEAKGDTPPWQLGGTVEHVEVRYMRRDSSAAAGTSNTDAWKPRVFKGQLPIAFVGALIDTALEQLHAHALLTTTLSEEEMCNDGDVYRFRAYSTTAVLVSWGLLRVRI